MGFLIVLSVLCAIAVFIVMFSKDNVAKRIAKSLGVGFMCFIFGAIMIAIMSSREFEKEAQLESDTKIEVMKTPSNDLLFKDGDRYLQIKEINFFNISFSDSDKMFVRKIIKMTPPSFFRFRSESAKYKLELPQSVAKDYSFQNGKIEKN